jgi:hypothetical protein
MNLSHYSKITLHALGLLKQKVIDKCESKRDSLIRFILEFETEFHLISARRTLRLIPFESTWYLEGLILLVNKESASYSQAKRNLYLQMISLNGTKSMNFCAQHWRAEHDFFLCVHA